MSATVEVRGVGLHPFGRFPDATLKDLVRVATVEALVDADLGVGDLDAVYSANGMAGMLQGQEQIRGQTVLREVGIEGIPIVNVENACASGSSALREAVLAVRAGAARTVLAVGFEKMFVDDRELSLNALETAADLDVVAGLGMQFTAIYAMRLRRRIDAGELSLDDLAAVSRKSHDNGARNPYAQHRKRVSEAEILASRPIAEPLTLLMCSSICDGAAAAIVTAADAWPRRERPEIVVRASAAASGFARLGEDDPSIATRCARAAYEEAGVGPEDVDVAEVHDAMAPGELLYYEQLGLCGPGEAARLIRAGDTEIDGRIPVNPSGGLSSRGHPVGATGIAQVAELVWQLRGEAGERQVAEPRLALAQNSGGWVEGESAACNVHVLERVAAWS
ncbi:MAG TPA: thiolase family protein [Solirubrobacterales bacterium]|nr:thiolase family protein [Solirubrobacterales bacterium]